MCFIKLCSGYSNIRTRSLTFLRRDIFRIVSVIHVILAYQHQQLIMLCLFLLKDYAKATVKEFLGIYGYEEDVDINIDDSGEGVGPRSETNTNSDTQSESSNSNQQTSQAEARIMGKNHDLVT